MTLRVRGLAWLSLSMAVACIGVGDGDGGHCLNPQPDLPCNHSTGEGASSGGATASSGSGPIIALPGSGGALDVGKGGSSGVTAGEPNGGQGDAQAGEGGDGSGASGASGASGDAGSAGASGNDVVR
ncbi:MAG: hypothetical protein ABIQ16_17490 [Polyangiaceae bacterium]